MKRPLERSDHSEPLLNPLESHEDTNHRKSCVEKNALVLARSPLTNGSNTLHLLSSSLMSLVCMFSTACMKSLDVSLVIDGSISVGSEDFKKSLEFLSEFVGHLSVSPEGTHVGAIVYGSTATVKFNLAKSEYHTLSKLQEAIKAFDFPGGGTRTDVAMQLAASGIFSSAAGDRVDAGNVLVVVTAGNTNGDVPFEDVLKPLQVRTV